MIPHQCLGSVWSRRDKSSRDRDAATVVATVDQFNAVSFRVISTVLMVSGHSNCHSHIEKENYKAAQHRARVITKWIDIAQVNKFDHECCKNFFEDKSHSEKIVIDKSCANFASRNFVS